jgi:hypothetical protein
MMEVIFVLTIWTLLIAFLVKTDDATVDFKLHQDAPKNMSEEWWQEWEKENGIG